MMYISRWKALGILLTALVACMLAVPNFFPEKTIQSWPKWAQRHVVLGLDLQGGSHLLLEVDTGAVRKVKFEQMRDYLRPVLRQAGVGVSSAPVVRGTSVEVGVRESDVQTALTKVRELSQPLGGILGGAGQRTLEISNQGGGRIVINMTEPAIVERVRQAVDQAIQIIERRINELGLVEPLVQRQGTDRILVQVPGLGDPRRLIDLVGKTAKLDFRMVDETMTPDQALANRPPPEAEILYGTAREGRAPYVIEKRVLVSGADLTDAQPGFDSRTSEPIVNFTFNTTGARKFGAATAENVGKRFAAVLDNEVITAPQIREPILQGRGQISGSFTVESANDLAILLRAGALPAPLSVIEQRVVGAGLGQDSISKGKDASYYGAALVVVFMVVTYGLFGVFASVAVGINVAMIFCVLWLVSTTRTLSDSIGIVLTSGS